MHKIRTQTELIVRNSNAIELTWRRVGHITQELLVVNNWRIVENDLFLFFFDENCFQKCEAVDDVDILPHCIRRKPF